MPLIESLDTPILISFEDSSSESSPSDGSSQPENHSNPYPCTRSAGHRTRKRHLKRKFDAFWDSEGQPDNCHSEANNAQESYRDQTIRELKEERRILRRILRDLRGECDFLKQSKQDEVQSRWLQHSENRKLETRLQTVETRLECSICRHNQIDCVTFCGHAFCQDCLKSWRMTRGSLLKSYLSEAGEMFLAFLVFFQAVTVCLHSSP